MLLKQSYQRLCSTFCQRCAASSHAGCCIIYRSSCCRPSSAGTSAAAPGASSSTADCALCGQTTSIWLRCPSAEHSLCNDCVDGWTKPESTPADEHSFKDFGKVWCPCTPGPNGAGCKSMRAFTPKVCFSYKATPQSKCTARRKPCIRPQPSFCRLRCVVRSAVARA